MHPCERNARRPRVRQRSKRTDNYGIPCGLTALECIQADPMHISIQFLALLCCYYWRWMCRFWLWLRRSGCRFVAGAIKITPRYRSISVAQTITDRSQIRGMEKSKIPLHVVPPVWNGGQLLSIAPNTIDIRFARTASSHKRICW